MLIKLAVAGKQIANCLMLPAIAGTLGFARGVLTPEHSGTKKEMSYVKGSTIGGGILGSIGVLGGSGLGVLGSRLDPEVAKMLPNQGSHLPKSALSGALKFGASAAITGAATGASAILGARLGRALRNKHKKDHKK